MEMFFLVCAAFGGTLLVCQALASLVGLGGGEGGDAGHGDVGHAEIDHGEMGHDAGDHDVGDGGSEGGHHDADVEDGGAAWYFGMLSFRAITAGFTFFGLGGLAAYYGGVDSLLNVVIALASGGVALYAVASMMRFLSRLKSDGTVRIERAVGHTGTVYLRVPGQKGGKGKVTLVLQNRTVEVQAVTSQDELPTGTTIKVVAVLSPDTVEVVPTSQETVTHV